MSSTPDYVRFAVCSAILFINHGSRDYLINTVNDLAYKSDNTSVISCNFNPSALHNSNFGRFQPIPFHLTKRIWSPFFIGGMLSAVHWGWLISLIIVSINLQRLKLKVILVCSLVLGGSLILVNEIALNLSSNILLIVRIFQGIFQGWSYPVVYLILEGSTTTRPVCSYFIVFLSPWVGSCLGVLFGWAWNSFTSTYVFGTLSLLLGIILTKVSFNSERDGSENTIAKLSDAWKECLKSPAVWSCFFVQFGAVMYLHWILLVLTFNLQLTLNRKDMVWNLFVAILVAGVFTRSIAVTAWGLLRNNMVTPLKRRRMTIFVGTFTAIVTLVLIVTVGYCKILSIFGLSILGVTGGVGVLLVGIRLNLHDLGPLSPLPFLLLGSIGSNLGSALATLLFPIIFEWQLVWLAPIGVIGFAFLAHSYFVSVEPLPHQTLIPSEDQIPTILVNGFPASEQREEIDNKSFKSLKSALSFKTALSKGPSRGACSFEDVSEGGFCSFPDTEKQECLSCDQDDGEEEIMSIKSGATSYRSINEQQANGSSAHDERGVVLSPQELERTTTWLSNHYNESGVISQKPTSLEKNRIERNVLLALQW